MLCYRCPCPDKCLQWNPFCEWAAKDPQDPVEMRHICDKSSGNIKPPPVIQIPPFRMRVRSFLRAILEWAKGGFKLVTSGESRRRRSICQSCEFLDRKHGHCGKCGCGMTGVVALKPWLKSAKCPLNKWESVA
jgi:hypothetical protein